MSSDHWESDSVKRPAQRGIHNSSPYPNESAFPKIVHPQTLATYSLMELYRQFSADDYCTGWMGDIENDERLQQEFGGWLSKRVQKNRHLEPNTPHQYKQHEETAIDSLAQIWTEVSKPSCQ